MGRKYEEPPIVEALCEFYFVGSEWDATVPGVFYDRIKDRFPQKAQLKQINVQFQISQGGAETRTVHDAVRGRFTSPDGSRLVQISKDLLVVNQLKPYPEKFDDWKPLVMDMLKTYREIAQPKGMDRIGIRFINRIDIAGPMVSMETFFRLHPAVPTDLAASHGPFMMRLELPPQKTGHQLIITFSSAPPTTPGSYGFLLDLYDIFAVREKESFQKLEDHLVEAHVNVEHAFETAITDEARRLFKETK